MRYVYCLCVQYSLANIAYCTVGVTVDRMADVLLVSCVFCLLSPPPPPHFANTEQNPGIEENKSEIIEKSHPPARESRLT